MIILLLCTAGISTTFLVQKMREHASKMNMQANIWSCSSHESNQEINKADVILLGPQLRYLLDKVQMLANDKPVRVLDMRTFGSLDGAQALEIAVNAWSGV